MEDCKVSIIIPVYNGEKYIRPCISGLRKQTYRNIECILIDDSSTDESGKICDRCAEEDARVRVIHQVNRGVSAARNKGIEEAQGEYILFFDIDDQITESVVEDNLRMAQKNNADVVLFCFWYFIVDKDRKIPNGMQHPFIGDRESYFHEMLIQTIDNEIFNAPWNKMYKKDFLIKNQLSFDSSYSIYEDAVFAAKMFQRAEKIVINNRKYYTYFLWPSGSAITRYADNYFSSITAFYRNAMDYCNMFEDNIAQKRKFSSLYLKLAMTNMKQISCYRDMSVIRKHELIRHICENKDIQMAIRMADHNPRKELVKRMIRKRKYREICTFYQLISLVQKKIRSVANACL